MRSVLSDLLVAAAKADPKVMLLTGDHGYALFDAFRKETPNQYLNCGIAEQNMVGVAAGLAKAGFRPIVYGLSAFVPIRVLEQIKIDVCYENLPVIFLGDGAGVVYSHLGASHQSTEDIAALRGVPGMNIYSPADRAELHLCMDWALSEPKPVYMRLGKADLGDVHLAGVKLSQRPGLALEVIDAQDDTLIVATGSMVKTACEVAKSRGGMAVYSVPSLKPFDQEQIRRIAAGRKLIVTLEEHNVIGGLGSAVAEALVGRYQGSLLPIGVPDQYSLKCGTYQYLIKSHGLDTQSVITRISEETG